MARQTGAAGAFREIGSRDPFEQVGRPMGPAIHWFLAAVIVKMELRSGTDRS
jgi:hypothetical protein